MPFNKRNGNKIQRIKAMIVITLFVRDPDSLLSYMFGDKEWELTCNGVSMRTHNSSGVTKLLKDIKKYL